MRKRIFVPVASLGLVFVGVVSAGASSISMNQSSGGNTFSIDALQLAPGNGLSTGLNGSSVVGTTGTFYFQANFSGFTNGGVPQFSNCLGGANCFTIVAGISETVVSRTTNSLTFGFNGATNFFDIYAAVAPGGLGNNETGNCFANETGCNKNLVLAGSFLNNGSFSGTFNLTPGTSSCNISPTPLDCFDNGLDGATGPDTIQSVNGNGSFQANLGNFTTVNANYFPSGLPAGLFFKTSTSSTSLPFDNVDPSQCFSIDGLTGGLLVTGACKNLAGWSSVGPVNGAGTNTMLQTTATLTPTVPSPVPEPATLTLLGFGLVAGAARLRRWTRKS